MSNIILDSKILLISSNTTTLDYRFLLGVFDLVDFLFDDAGDFDRPLEGLGVFKGEGVAPEMRFIVCLGEKSADSLIGLTGGGLTLISCLDDEDDDEEGIMYSNTAKTIVPTTAPIEGARQ